MDEHPQTVSPLEKGLTEIIFPRPINEAEVDELIRYLVMQSGDEPADSRMSITTHWSHHRYYGDNSKKTVYESLDSVPVIRDDIKLLGHLILRNPRTKKASFEFRPWYDKFQRPVFTGIDFITPPDYKLGDSGCNSAEVMRKLQEYVRSYFVLADKTPATLLTPSPAPSPPPSSPFPQSRE